MATVSSSSSPDHRIARPATASLKFQISDLKSRACSHKSTANVRGDIIGMKTIKHLTEQAGGVGGYALLWLLGIPLPILLIIFLVRGH